MKLGKLAARQLQTEGTYEGFIKGVGYIYSLEHKRYAFSGKGITRL